MRLAAAKAYLAKSKNSDQKPVDQKRAKVGGADATERYCRKSPGLHLEEAKAAARLLLVLIPRKQKLPTAEPPKSLDEALASARQLLEAGTGIEAALAALKDQGESPDLVQQRKDLNKQLVETRAIAIQILRAGIGMANSRTDIQVLNQATAVSRVHSLQE